MLFNNKYLLRPVKESVEGAATVPATGPLMEKVWKHTIDSQNASNSNSVHRFLHFQRVVCPSVVITTENHDAVSYVEYKQR